MLDALGERRCDKEMGVNAQTRDDKTEEVNTLSAEVRRESLRDLRPAAEAS